jgi:hypothetical protein
MVIASAPSLERLSRLRSQLRPAVDSATQPQQPATTHRPGPSSVSSSAAIATKKESVCPEFIYDPEMLAAFDPEQFRRDGYVCFPGIMTPACRKQWSASLRRLQEIQDFMIWNTDWDNMDWGAQRELNGQPLSGKGAPTPEKPITPEQKRIWAGTSEATYRAFPGGYGRGLHCNLPLATPPGVQNHGFFPEHFPLAYDPFLMEVVTQHPQMLALQHALHGDAGPLRVDHTILLNRKAGATGRTWHSHLYGPGDTQDHDVTEGTGLFLVRTLCFPDGVTPGKADRPAVPEDANAPETSVGGLVGMIPGAHHFKDPWPGPRVSLSRSRQNFVQSFFAGTLKMLRVVPDCCSFGRLGLLTPGCARTGWPARLTRSPASPSK